MMDALYNKRSMLKYGWGPADVGVTLVPGASDVFIASAVSGAVKALQAKHGLKQDGLVGPVTVRYVLANRDLIKDSTDLPVVGGKLLIGGSLLSVPFRCVPPTDNNGLNLIPHTSNYGKRPSKKPSLVVWHWDVTRSAAKCFSVLKSRGYSSHGCIDNDGTLYQFLDLADHYGWHAGDNAVNRASIGFDLSNAVSMAHQAWYSSTAQGPRPVVSSKTNGITHSKHLGFYPAQIEAARDIAEYLYMGMGIALDTPLEASVIRKPELFKGHIGHYHVTNMKWDPASFPFNYVVGKQEIYG